MTSQNSKPLQPHLTTCIQQVECPIIHVIPTGSHFWRPKCISIDPSLTYLRVRPTSHDTGGAVTTP